MVNHLPHQVQDAGELLAHLVSMHDYTAGALSGGTRSFLLSVHERAHRRMAEHPDEGTVAEMAGSAERLSRSALETLERLLPQDRELGRRIAGRWVEAITALVGR